MSVARISKSFAAVTLVASMGLTSPSFAQDDNQNENIPTSNNKTEAASLNTTLSSVNNDIHVKPYNGQLPLNQFYLLLALGVLGSGYMVYSRKDGAALKTLAFATGLTAIANPHLVIEEYRQQPTVIPVFVDQSESIGDRQPHVEQSFENLQTQLQILGPVEIRRINFGHADDDISAVTSLTTPLETTLSTINFEQLGASFIITDGILSDQRQYLQVGSDKYIHALVTGHDSEQDYYIEVNQAPKLAFVDDNQKITITVADAANLERKDKSALVDISYGGVFLQQLNVPLNRPYEIEMSDLNLKDGLAIGKNIFEFTINNIGTSEILDIAEVSRLNNKTAIEITGVSSDIKVLLLSGKAYTGVSLWRDILKNDPSVSLTHFGYIYPNLKQDPSVPLRDLATVALPVQEILDEKIDEFSFIVLDGQNFDDRIPLEYFDRIKQYVEEGGSLIIVANEEFNSNSSLTKTPLGEIIPFTPLRGDGALKRQFKPALTPDGAKHPIGRTLANSYTNWGSWYQIMPGIASETSTILMSDDIGNPLLITDKTDEGRVSVLTSNQAILWANGHQGGGPASTLYQALSGWSAQNPKYEEEQLTLAENRDKITVTLQTLEDDAQTVIITAPSGQETIVTPTGEDGLYTASIPKDERGVYSVRRENDIANTNYTIAGKATEAELRDVISQTEVIRPLTDDTSGQTVRVVDANNNFAPPTIGALNDDNAKDTTQLLVDMSDKKEPIGAQEKPLAPPWAYALAFGLMLAGSFRQKEMINAISSPFKKREHQNDSASKMEI